jgi:hypothetical protein
MKVYKQLLIEELMKKHNLMNKLNQKVLLNSMNTTQLLFLLNI